MFRMIEPAPITAYIGINGSGKTLSAIAIGIRDHRRFGRPLITNVGGLSAPHFHFDDVEQLPDLMEALERVHGDGTCTLVMDEAGAMFSSRNGGQAKAFQHTVQQLRKYDTRLLWTAPTYARAEKIMREVSLDAILCQKLRERRVKGKVWGSTRLVLQKRFDVSRLDHSGQTMNKNAKAKGFGLIRTGRWQNEFDTFARAGLGEQMDRATADERLAAAARGNWEPDDDEQPIEVPDDTAELETVQ